MSQNVKYDIFMQVTELTGVRLYRGYRAARTAVPRPRTRAELGPPGSAGPSVFDLSGSGPLPPGSEGLGPPKQKTKTSRYMTVTCDGYVHADACTHARRNATRETWRRDALALVYVCMGLNECHVAMSACKEYMLM